MSLNPTTSQAYLYAQFFILSKIGHSAPVVYSSPTLTHPYILNILLQFKYVTILFLTSFYKIAMPRIQFGTFKFPVLTTVSNVIMNIFGAECLHISLIISLGQRQNCHITRCSQFLRLLKSIAMLPSRNTVQCVFQSNILSTHFTTLSSHYQYFSKLGRLEKKYILFKNVHFFD